MDSSRDPQADQRHEQSGTDEIMDPALSMAWCTDNSSTMFEQRSDRGYRPVLDGIERKTLVYGAKTLMTEFQLRKGAVLPRQSHPHDQSGYLVRGRIRLFIGNEKYEAQAGDSWCIPGEVEHGADILEDSVAVEVFSPVRDDYVSGRTSG